jgi:hypothetical protein
MSTVVRRVTLVAALAAALVAAAACEPAKKAPPKDTPPTSSEPNSVAFYFVVEGQPNGGNLLTSPSPQNVPVCEGTVIKGAGGPGNHVTAGPVQVLPRASQSRTPNGSVALAIQETPGGCNVAVGFGVAAGTLGNLTSSSIRAVTGSDPVVLALALDGNSDGHYGGKFGDEDLGADDICTVSSLSGSTTLTGATSVRCLAGGEIRAEAREEVTLNELKATAGNVPVALLAVLPNTTGDVVAEGVDAAAASVGATVDSVKVNGTEQLR